MTAALASPVRRVRHKPSETRRSYAATVHVLSPGADLPHSHRRPMRVHTVNITYTERALSPAIVRATGHEILANGQLSKTTTTRDAWPPESWPAWLSDLAEHYAPSWSPLAVTS